MRKFSCSIVLLVVILVFSVSNTAHAKQDVKYYKGVYHEDGSYQFSASELKKLNALTKSPKFTCTERTVKEVLSIVAPEYYNTFDDKAKQYLDTLNWSFDGITTQEVSIDGSFKPNAYSDVFASTIGNYGNSLKGYSYSETSSTNPMLYIACRVFNYDTGELVAISGNLKYNTTFVSATTIVAPPTGKYWCKGYHEYVKWCQIHQIDEVYTYVSSSRTMSYVSPY
ncbi:MAG: hypothetical protein BWY11_02459 [Firmicutes bacterium ADurb.Bin182]|nr:MAG: hypothetical protein BWY11_02459 [Firmicutes bacterium ADurb.Bin182]